MAFGARDRQAGDRHHPAPTGLPAVWTWKSRRRLARPTVPADLRTLIRRMAQADPRWGAPTTVPGSDDPNSESDMGSPSNLALL